MLLVDVTIVQVALPSIQRSLKASFADQEWVISGYALTLSALILMMGALSDRFGRKALFLFGVAEFTLASLTCGLARNATELIVARGAQGIGGAAMFATALALIGQEFSGRERASAIAAWGATVGGAVAIGPLIGGALTSGLGWQWIFYVNIPIGVFIFATAATRIANVADPAATRLDLAGVVTFSAMLFLLVFALVKGKDDGWSSGTILTLFAASAALLVAFIVAEVLQERPMLDLSLFRNRSFLGVSLATFCISAGMFAMLPYLTFYLQDFLGFSPLQGGLRLLPATILTFAVPIASRSVTERLAPGLTLAAGLGICGLGLLLIHGVALGDSWTSLLPGLLLTGLGIGIGNPAIARIALGVVTPTRAGMASGISNTFRIGGLSVGVAGLGAIFQSGIVSALGGGQAQLARAVAGEGPRDATRGIVTTPALQKALSLAFLHGLNDITLVGSILVFLGAAAALVVRGRDFHRQLGPSGQVDGPSVAG